jgi:hypothetical protein
MNTTKIVINDKFRQLAEQAGMTDDKYGMFFAVDKHTEDGVDLEKFALLIVQKCADIADTAEPFLSSDLIKQHFGVKE